MNCEHEGRNAEDPYTVALRERWHYRWPHPHTISYACTPRHGNAVQCTVTESIHLIVVGRAGFSALCVPIYNTPNSLFTEATVDREMLLGKELGLARLE